MKRFLLGPSMYILIGLAFVGAGTASASSVYVGLGDSITFGETDLSYVTSYGDRGYVADFASKLASQNGGTAPMVVNLAIDGETAASFMSGARANDAGNWAHRHSFSSAKSTLRQQSNHATS